MGGKNIRIRGAREHNLKGIDVDIPRNKLVVITGLSGSGKSTLAFDTLYAEGQRRYVESLSAYARQFLEQMDKPAVDSIEGLSPAIAIEQRTAAVNPRSTVSTVTEIHDYLRLLYARAGRRHCHRCGAAVRARTVDEMVDEVMELGEGTPLVLLAPVVSGAKGAHGKLLEKIRRDGFVRVRVDGKVRDLDEDIKLAASKKHEIDIVVDRLVMEPGMRARLADSIETALSVGGGAASFIRGPGAGGASGRGKKSRSTDIMLSCECSCTRCGIRFDELSPRSFSFNSPYGACPGCAGLGKRFEIDPALVVPDGSKSLQKNAIEPWARGGRALVRYFKRLLRSLSRHYGFKLETPYEKLPRKVRDILLRGSGDEEIEVVHWRSGRWHRYKKPFEGVIPNLERRFRESGSDYIKRQIRRYMVERVCHDCRGERLRPESLAVTVGGKSIAEVAALPVSDACDFFAGLKLEGVEKTVGSDLVKEVEERLRFMADVGLGYLTLDRRAATLSGGEAERIRLATQIGSGLVGVLYILDEPSIGLHARDTLRLLGTLERLRDLGNTVVVVEHDETTIRSADHVIDLGPGAGKAGGEVVACGSPRDVMDSAASITGQYLKGDLSIPVPQKRRPLTGRWLELKGAREHNLKTIDVRFPLGVFICVTGVSGSGKSTLVDETLRRALARKLHGASARPGRYRSLVGIRQIGQVIEVDQSPIGRTPRSNPATYTGIFDLVRSLFAQLPEARVRGYRPGRFSFNVRGGRCEACSGDGLRRVEMHFLPDIYVQCPSCLGTRYGRETLEIRYREKSIAEVLELSVTEALEFFSEMPAIKRKLRMLSEVGLGYVKLGQSATTLSGGEAQRVKLGAELARGGGNGRRGDTLYILDEPTTGLHFADVQRLLHVLGRLVDGGATVIVIEHNLDVIKTADHLVDLGPGGGESGGRVVASGTPEEVARTAGSCTGEFLKPLLARS